AILRENLAAGSDVLTAGIAGRIRKRRYERGYLRDLVALEDVGEGRHFRVSRIRIFGKANAVSNACADVLGTAAPQPVVIVQIGIAGRPLSAGAMTLHAIDPECRSAR